MLVNPFQSVGVQLFPLRRAEWPPSVVRRRIESVMMLVSFATGRWMDALIYLTIAVPER